MKIREQKRLRLYLEVLAKKLETEEEQHIHPVIQKQLNTEDLINILLWMFPKIWTREKLISKKKEELLSLIHTDANILWYTIDQLEKQMNNIVKYSQEEIHSFFSKTNNEMHYLASKPVTNWDAYDKANYHSLMSKTNTTKRVFGIFTSDVLAEDVYAVTTKPSYFFDTKEEAEAEIENIIKEENFQRDELTIHSLWLIQNYS